jgi:hypothetical protein
MGECAGLTPVVQKRGHGFNLALLIRWLPAGKNGKDMGAVCAKDKLTTNKQTT